MKHTSLYLFKIGITKGLEECHHIDGSLYTSTKDFIRFEGLFGTENFHRNIEVIIDDRNNKIKTVNFKDPDIISTSPIINWLENYDTMCYAFYLSGVLPVIIKIVRTGWMFLFYNEEYGDIEAMVKDFRNKRKVSLQKSIINAKIRLNTNIALGETSYYLPIVGIQ